MKVAETEIPDVKVISPNRFGDDRGWFEEIYRQDILAAAGIHDVFVQDNVSFSISRGTIRGLHFQTPPSAQAKLVRVLVGSAFDVAVDLRPSSKTYGRHVIVEIDAKLGRLVYIPTGFAHGFCTLEPGTLLSYKVSSTYDGACDRSLAWNDPALGIEWPVAASDAILSAKDRAAPEWAKLERAFE
ncbi:dTDP-4-dehydrorhamnose 3,5-epimerase [Reyranella sp.]|uniref:dTDP-4-dehydrorhamnose 3,5-epimerase n=1 Tax=Reyranella sp. TaxID=1929291 RepID=UPI003D0E408C